LAADFKKNGLAQRRYL